MRLLDAQQLARHLFEKHGIADYAFGFDRAKRRRGHCTNGKRLITLSKHFVELNDEARVRITLLHEIAHALNWKRNRAGGHGAKWRTIARELGIKPERCSSEPSKMPDGKFVGVCLDCEMTCQRYRRPEPVGHYHPKCRRARRPNLGRIVWYTASEWAEIQAEQSAAMGVAAEDGGRDDARKAE